LITLFFARPRALATGIHSALRSSIFSSSRPLGKTGHGKRIG
jgi:hypothetical protein